MLIEKFPEIKSVIMNKNEQMTNVIMGSKCMVIAGSDIITDIMCGNKITLSPLSFYQVNTVQAERLYSIAKEYAELSGNETVVELYCGAGTIGLSFSGVAKEIIGVEIVPQAIENAKGNAKANNIQNIRFFCADAGEFAQKLATNNTAPDLIVVDPPSYNFV